jgi:RES domain-containing protein
MRCAAEFDSGMLSGLPIVRDAFPRTVRLVSSARLRESVLRALVDEDDLNALFEIEGATSTRLRAQDGGLDALNANEFVYGVPHAHFINAAFAYSKPKELNRFNGPGRGAWYAALDVMTCLQEVVFHMTEFLERTENFDAVVEYAEMFASMAGEFLDLRGIDHPALGLNASAYMHGNALAEAAKAKGLNGIIYSSVRHSGGTCFAALWPHAVQSVAPGDLYRLTWAGNRAPAIEKVQGAAA